MLSLNAFSGQVYNSPTFGRGASKKLAKKVENTLIEKGWTSKGAKMYVKDQIPTVEFIRNTFKFGRQNLLSVEECEKLQAGRIRKLLEKVQAKDF